MPVTSRRRWWVLRALGKNPLVRRTDRIEALAVVLAIVVSVLVIPYVISFGEEVHAGQLREAAVQAQTRHPVQATVVSDSESNVEGANVRIVGITWTVNGEKHTGALRPTGKVEPGDQVQIWIDGKGQRVPPPISATTARAYATGSSVALWAAITVLCGLVALLTRKVLDQHRAHAWSDELYLLLNHGDGRTKWSR
ncbi:Rv1733c family protein [Mycolicibacterium goodii]|uniref:Transmembrane protein n=1 Tax=Mycolicibacterium goodii TaxID=134601 RepID=A0ABS6HHC7_MYCGD|nr:hypothetical protein [Mycolicibacterium goodii]MBU8818412.1 hypothetical protein [Mycolicibacterium goodii]MBU8821985.1 hypothetical protein [Mycolicibacterium goodii]MBU8828479.1 hypothetical protein [Mycolicibacterium goodii]MBU8838765.1 hypothetical protein [Mycolicibacterium goodii]PJK22650.1 hypothetical protein CSX11_08845 [Mycolicibacterium goodii]